jgi:hypothetical protein
MSKKKKGTGRFHVSEDRRDWPPLTSTGRRRLGSHTGTGR